MPLTLDENDANYQIRAYKPGFIQVNDEILTQSILIAADKLVTNWAPQRIGELTRGDLDAVVEWRPAILIIGTGETLVFPGLEVYGDLLNLGIGVEVMNTGAACRTFNALTAEGRDVVGALVIK